MEREILRAWRQFIEGDNQALGCIYTTYYGAMLAVSYSYVQNNEIAKDLVSDVFAKLISLSPNERKNKLSEVNEKLEIFLKVLAKNKSLDYLKVEKNRKGILLSIFDRVSRSSNNDLLDRDLKLMLDALPVRQRQVLELHLEGYKNEEISVKLGMSYNTCKNTLSTSKKKIKQVWQIFMS